MSKEFEFKYDDIPRYAVSLDSNPVNIDDVKSDTKMRRLFHVTPIKNLNLVMNLWVYTLFPQSQIQWVLMVFCLT